jgi:hypothetical protein
VLSAEFTGAAELRVQAATVQAHGEGLIIDLIVDPTLPLAEVTHRAPVEAPVEDGGDPGGLILFVDAGRLSGLEYWWTGDEKPREFPPIEAIGKPAPSRSHT